MARSSFDSLITKDYECEKFGKTPKKLKDTRREKLQGYVVV